MEEQGDHGSRNMKDFNGERTWLSSPPSKRRQFEENGSIMISPAQEANLVMTRKGEEEKRAGDDRAIATSQSNSIQKKKKKKKKRLQQREEDCSSLLFPVNR